MRNNNRDEDYTPTQRRILVILNDGLAHSVESLMTCLNDDLTGLNTLRCHISLLRRRLRPRGSDICCHRDNGTSYYRIVRLVRTSE